MEFFEDNGFPVKLVHGHIRRLLLHKSTPPNAVLTVPKKEVYANLTYIGSNSKLMKSELQKVISQFFPHIDLKLIFCNKFTTASLFHFKDKIPLHLRSGIVYKYSCAECSACYLGSTLRAFYVRRAEHRGLSHRTGRPLGVPAQSSIRAHGERCVSARDSFFKIVDYESNKIKLRILESLHINKDKPSLNEMDSAFQLILV